MTTPDQLFAHIKGQRAMCVQDGCREKKNYNVQLEDDHAYCHRCEKTWWYEENTIAKPTEVKRLKNTKAISVDKSDFDYARDNIKANFKYVVQSLDLPWTDIVLDSDFGLGVRNNNDEAQLVFKISANHIKYHKGKQFGNAECKIYPSAILNRANRDSTLLVVEGEKDALTAISHGASAITFTSGAGALPGNIDDLKEFKKIVIIYDADDKGRIGAIKVAKALFKQKKNRSIKILKWINKSDTYDLTDYFTESNTLSDLYSLIELVEPFGVDARDFGGLQEFDPDSFMIERNKEVVEICEEIMLENGRTALAGSSNVGKSILALQFAMCVAMGVPFMQFTVPKPRRVLFVQFELLDTMIAKRLKPMAKMLLDKYPFAEKHYKRNLRITSADHREIFSDAYDSLEGNLLSANPPYDVVVVDNLYTSTNIDIAKNDQLTKLLSKLQTLREDHQVALMLVSHHKKQEERRPLEHSMIFGGSNFVNWMDNVIQVANTGRHKYLKVLKITKGRWEEQFLNAPLGIYLHTDNDQLHFEYKAPLPKGEMYWYTEATESEEDRVLSELNTKGGNFTTKDMADALKTTFNITSSRSVANWLKKLEKMGYIKKVEHGHWIKIPDDLEKFIL